MEAFNIGGVIPFGDSSSKLHNRCKNQRYWFERKDDNNSKQIARHEANKEWICKSQNKIKNSKGEI